MKTPSVARDYARSGYWCILGLALAWAIGNVFYVYAILGGSRTYRVEAAVFVLLLVIAPLGFLPPRSPFPRLALMRSDLVAIAVVALGLWLSLYVWLLRYPFLSDDYVFLDLFQRPADLLRQPEFFRPLFALVFWLLHRLGGSSPVPFHLLSLALHFGSACLVYRLSSRLFSSPAPAVLAGALFLVNPLQLEAVLWISGLQELLWSFFVLAALTVYTGCRDLSLWRLLATSALVACGLLSKEPAVSYILLLPAADLVLFRMRRRHLIPAYALLVCELIAYLLIRQQLKPVDAAYFVAPTRYFVKQLVTTPYRSFVHPWNQSAVHVPGVVLAAAAILVLALLVYAVWQRRRTSLVFAGAFLIVATTLPVYRYLYVAADLASSRYIYCAAAGWAIIVAELTATAFERRRAFVIAAVGVVAFGACSLYLNVRPWLVAGDVVHSLVSAPPTRHAIEEVLDTWRTAAPKGLSWKNDAPYTYDGVGLFINGFGELVRLREQGKLSP